MQERRIIRISNNQIFLTPNTCINLSDTSLKGESLKFRAAKDIYWEIEIYNHNKPENIVEVTVIDYNSKNIKKFNEQISKRTAPFLKFQPLSWKNLEPQLTGYQKSKLESEKIIFDDDDRKEIKSSTIKRNIYWGAPPKQVVPDEKEVIPPKEPINMVINETGKVYFKKVEFHLGYAEFSYKVERLNFTLKLKIENEFLKPEFNNIKSYFPKVLGVKKQFSINVKITIENNKIIHKQTTSDAIERIDTTVIDSIERVRVNKITSLSLRKKTNKSLFTSDEILESFENNQNSKTEFKQSEKEILDLIVKVKKSRNSTHLQFLSGSKQSKNQKLKFTLKPHFGFLFFIEGENKNHFCWELLDSHATYLWSFDKNGLDTESQFTKIEGIINLISEIGRDNYKKEFKNDTDNDGLSFCRIPHSHVGSSFKNGFIDWKEKLNELLE